MVYRKMYYIFTADPNLKDWATQDWATQDWVTQDWATAAI